MHQNYTQFQMLLDMYIFYLQMQVYEIRFLISLQIIWTLSAFLKDALNLIIPDFYNKTPVLKVS